MKTNAHAQPPAACQYRAHSPRRLGFAASCFLLLALGTPLQAGPRADGPYRIPTDTVDAGGTRSIGGLYTNDGSIGAISGVSSVALPAATSQAGYVAQLHEITGLVVNSAQLTVAEGAAFQLGAWQLLDDASFLAVDAAVVAWGTAVAPIESISSGGLATAAMVYQDTAGTVQGSFEGFSATFDLTVLNVGLDDFESYAGDLIDDEWQVLHFGLPPNALAGPGIDADGDGQDNGFEFTAGLIPTDASSVFTLRIEKAAPPSTDKNLIFSPRFEDRTYTVQFHPSLTTPPDWATLGGTSQSDAGDTRTVTDPNATGTKFYRIEITNP